MSLGDFIAATAAFVVVGGALATLIKIFVEITVSHEIAASTKVGTVTDKNVDQRLNRCERRIYGLELRVFNQSDTFGSPE
jgi:hypothetical protein